MIPDGCTRAKPSNPYEWTDEQLAERERWVEDALKLRPNSIGGHHYLEMIWDVVHRAAPDELASMRARVLASEAADEKNLTLNTTTAYAEPGTSEFGDQSI